MKNWILKTLVAGTLMMPGAAQAQGNAISKSIHIDSSKPSAMIDPMLYGQLFEHIYFSANNGVWQELIFERSFEPEHYPGIHPRDGYFDGWFADEEQVLHSPTRYEQPIHVASVEGNDYDITLDLKWRSYRLARRAWSGGLMDIRFAFKNQQNGDPYFVRLHNPYYEVRSLAVAQTEEMRKNEELNKMREAMTKGENAPNFSISTMVEKEVDFRGRKRTMKTLDALVKKVANEKQINENQDWHKLRISCRGNGVKVYYDGKQVLSYNKLDKADINDITFWVNYTEAYYRNIKVTSANGKETYFEGLPQDVQIPSVAPQWHSFGNGEFKMVKGDAVNMNYSQQITAHQQMAGIVQGPQNVVAGEKYQGYIYAKGDGILTIGLKNGRGLVARQSLGTMTGEWKKYEFELSTPSYNGDADFAICVENGTVQVDEASMTTLSGKKLGGFRPDIFNAVKQLHPTCMRWPGGGYVAQYDWRWGVGPQEKRRRWDHWMWMDYDQNCFGTDEFLRFCREVNSEPVLVVSVAFERPDSEFDEIMENALNWLRYCNEPATGEWGAKRAANGHPEPYNVKYWEIDNEMWEMGIEKYENCVRRYSEAMRKIDPSIKIIACGGFQEDADFIARSGNYFDYLSLHHYEQQNGYATGPINLGKQYDRYAEMIAKSPNPNIKLFISEWNLNSQDWRTGLFAGGFLNMCESKDVVAMGAAALFIRRTDSPDWNNAFINFDYKDVYVAPNYQVTDLWYDHFSRYLLSQTGDTGELNVVSTMSEDGKSVIVKVVNPTDKPYSLALNSSWAGVNEAEYEYFAPGDLMIGNTMQNKNAVALQRRSVAPSNKVYTLHVEAYSAGVLTIER
ncbi:MAG: alpha-L-arabinofuranosidase [Bacteroidaceae bacterium]|nr:alpha-L-arabinofuranosidase [Bacteroidaceae bacterium]